MATIDKDIEAVFDLVLGDYLVFLMGKTFREDGKYTESFLRGIRKLALVHGVSPEKYYSGQDIDWDSIEID